MRSLLLALVVALAAGACGDSASTNPSGGSSGVPNGTSSSSSGGSSSSSSSSSSGAGDDDDDIKPKLDAGPPGTNAVRILAGNLTSGTKQAYEDPGTRIFQGLKPDIALVQEFNVGDKSVTATRAWVTLTFGADYNYFREAPVGSGPIPNGVVSRFPILDSGQWTADANNRAFAFTKIDAPGGHILWAISVHLLTAGSTERQSEATKLVAEIKKVVQDGDYVVVGGDFNTDNRNEPCLATLDELVDAKNSHAADGAGKENTNAPRSKPYDWVVGSPNLIDHQVPTVIGANTFTNGLVFDSRVFTPLTDVAPIQAGDSAVTGMQHMAVVKDFKL